MTPWIPLSAEGRISSNWHSCTDKMPPPDKRILVLRGDEPLYNPCIATLIRCTGGPDVWQYEQGFYCGGSPTHWMDLPEGI